MTQAERMHALERAGLTCDECGNDHFPSLGVSYAHRGSQIKAAEACTRWRAMLSPRGVTDV